MSRTIFFLLLLSSWSRCKWIPAADLNVHHILLNIFSDIPLSLAEASVIAHVMYSPIVADPGMQIGSGSEGGDIGHLNLSEVIRNTIMPCLLIINHS